MLANEYDGLRNEVSMPIPSLEIRLVYLVLAVSKKLVPGRTMLQEFTGVVIFVDIYKGKARKRTGPPPVTVESAKRVDKFDGLAENK